MYLILCACKIETNVKIAKNTQTEPLIMWIVSNKFLSMGLHSCHSFSNKIVEHNHETSHNNSNNKHGANIFRKYKNTHTHMHGEDVCVKYNCIWILDETCSCTSIFLTSQWGFVYFRVHRRFTKFLNKYSYYGSC